MALLYADSFEHLDTGRYLGFSNDGGNNGPLVSGAGRRGTAACRTGDNGTFRSLGVTAPITTYSGSALILACAIKLSDTAGRVLQLDGSSELLSIRGNGASGWLLTHNNGTRVSGGDPINSGTWYYVEAKITEAGYSELRVNGVVVGTDSGTTTTLSSITEVTVGRDSTDTAVDGLNNYVDDLVVMDDSGSTANDFLGDVRVQYLMPTTDGDTIELTGSDGDQVDNYDNINESNPSGFPGADYNSSTGIGDMDLYGLAGLSTGNNWTVHGVQLTAKIGKITGGNAYGRLLAKDASSTEYGTIVGLTTSGAQRFLQLSASPSGTSWTTANYEDLQIGFQVTGATGV